MKLFVGFLTEKSSGLFFLLLFCFTAQGGSAQTTGDYRTVAAGTNWSSLTSWQRWNGSAWATPSAGEGYPGQNTGTGNVIIRFGGSKTLDVSPANAIGSLNVGDGTITGSGISNAAATLTIGAFTLEVTGNIVISSANGSRNGTLNNSSGTVKTAGALSTAGGTYTAGTGTFEYNAAGNQNIFNTTYYNLVTNGSGTKTMLGATTVSHDLTIESGTTIDQAAFTTTLGSGSVLTVNGTLDFSSSTGLIRTGNNLSATLTMGSAGLIKTADDLGLGPVANASLQNQGTGLWTASSISTNGTVEYYRNVTSGQAVTDRDYNNLVISGTSQTKTWTIGATRTISGSVSIGGTFTISGTQTINVGTDWTNTGTFTPGTSTINFNGSGTGNIGSSNFNNITFSGAGTKTATGALTILGNVSLTDNFTAGSFTHTVGGNWTNSGTFTATGSTIDFNGSGAGNIGSSNFNNITFSGAGTKTATGALTIAGSVSLTNNFTAGSFTHTVGGNWTNSGTFIGTGSTMDFNGTTQSIGGSASTTFNNLTLSNSGTKTFGIAFTCSGNMSIATGVVADLGTFSHTANTLTRGGFGANSGSFGHTSSSATYKDAVFFANNTGIVTISASTCAAVTAVLSGANTICNGGSSNLIVTITGGLSPYTVVYSAGTVNNYTTGSNISVSPSSTTGYSLTSVTDTNGCTASVSGTPTVTVQSVPTSGSIGTAQTICYNTTPSGLTNVSSGTGDGIITYRWESNTNLITPSWSVISGQTAANYTPGALTVTTQYRRITISTLNSVACESAPTATVQVTVQSVPTAGSIGTDQTICNGGDPAAFSSTTNGTGDGTITYRWESNTNLIMPSWSVVSGETASTYDVPSGLNVTTQYRRITISTLNSVACESVPTATIQVTVQSIPTAGAIDADQTICNGGDPAAFSSTTNGTGDGTITYRWESNTNLITPSWSTISGETASTYDVPSGLTVTTQYRRITISTLNSVSCESLPSAMIQVTVQSVPTAGVIDADQTICNGGNPVAFTSTSDGSGDGTITYRWESNTNLITPSWSVISGETASTYDVPSGLTVTTQYRRITISTLNSVVCESAPTADVQITVQGIPSAGAIAADQTICYNTTPSGLTSTTVGTGDGTISYRWELNTNLSTPSWSTISGETAATYTPGALTQTTQYRRFTISTLNGVDCESVPTAAVQVTVYAEFTPGAINITGETICYNGNPSLIGSATDASGGDGTITYQWQEDNVDIPGANGATYDPPSGLTSTTTYTRYAKDATCNTAFELSTGSWVVTVQSIPTAGTIDADQTICSGGNPAAFTSTTDGTGDGTITYRWESNTNLLTPSWSTVSGETTSTYDVPSGLAATTQYRRITISTLNSVACESSPTALVQVTVDPLSVGGSVSSNQTICSGTEPVDLTLSGNTGSVVKWQSSTDAVFTSPMDIAETSTTLLGTTIGSLTENTYFRAVVQSGVCADANSSSVLITVDELSVGGTVNGDATVCPGSTSGLLTLTGYTGTIVRWESAVDPFVTWIPISNTSSTYTSGALTETTQFRAVIQNGTCAETESLAATISIITTTYDGVSWDNGDPTGGNKTAVISGDYTSSGESISVCSLTIDSSAVVVISSGDTVTTGDFVVDSGSFTSSGNVSADSLTVNTATVVMDSGATLTLNGALTANTGSIVTIKSNANLIQTTNAANTGAITVKRESSLLKRLDYTLWSSPVANQNLKTFSLGTLDDRFYKYNTNTNFYNLIPSPSTTNFEAAKGYLIRMPNNHPTTPTIWTGNFTGVPNNGSYAYTMEDFGATKRFNLVGNPYPSPIDANAFVGEATNSSNITGTLYFWRKTNNALSPSYCTWSTGGFVSNGEAQVYDPLGVIQTGQGFFVEATGSGTTLNFDNSMRLDDHANQFFKTSNTVERNRIWLNAKSSTGSFSQTMIGYMSDATNGVDARIDGRFINDGDIALTSIIENTAYAIQGRSLPFDITDVVPLSFKATTAGAYTISIDHVDGFFSNVQDIYLRDKLNGSDQNLKESSYTFASDAGTFTSRFEIIYQNTTLGQPSPVFDSNQVIIYKSDDSNFIVNTGNTLMEKIKVFDIRGRLLLEKNDIHQNQTNFFVGDVNEIVLVQITSVDGIIITKKVLR